MTTPSKPSTPPGDSTRQSGPTFQAQTKAEWLRDEFFPDNPTFPLHAEVIASIPEDLPGEIPTNADELYADVQLPQSTPRASQSCNR